MTAYPFDTLSFSSINQFAGYGSCQMGWYLDRIEKLPPDRPKGMQLALGNAFDAAAMMAVQAKIDGSSVSSDDAVGVLLDAWTDEIGTGEYDTSEGSNLPGLAPTCVRVYVEDVLPKLRPIEVQKQLDITFNEVPWRLTGRLDILAEHETGGEVVIDTKATASSSTKYEARGDLQLGIYAAARELEGGEPVATAFHVARVLKTKAEIVGAGADELAPSTPETRQESLELVAGIATAIESACETGTFLPTAKLSRHWKCSAKFCDYYLHTCPHGARSRTVHGFVEAES